jgi:hypothetical protein
VMSDAHLHPPGHWQGTSLGTLVTIWLAHGNQCSGNGARAAASVPGARMRSEPGAAGRAAQAAGKGPMARPAPPKACPSGSPAHRQARRAQASERALSQGPAPRSSQ